MVVIAILSSDSQPRVAARAGRRTGQGRASTTTTGSYEVTFARPVRASRCSGSADRSQLRQPKRRSNLESDRVRAPASHPSHPSPSGGCTADSSSLSNLRAHSESEVGAPVVTGGPHAAAISESSERQRAAKSRRCSARGIESPRPRRQRKYCRNSSNAEQKRAADAKLPKPRIG